MQRWCLDGPKPGRKTNTILVAVGLWIPNSPKVTKDYYVVREGQSDKCKVVTGDFGNKPVGAIGGAPYANKNYAEVALKKFPECKGGNTDEAADDKHRKK